MPVRRRKRRSLRSAACPSQSVNRRSPNGSRTRCPYCTDTGGTAAHSRRHSRCIRRTYPLPKCRNTNCRRFRTFRRYSTNRSPSSRNRYCSSSPPSAPHRRPFRLPGRRPRRICTHWRRHCGRSRRCGRQHSRIRTRSCANCRKENSAARCRTSRSRRYCTNCRNYRIDNKYCT